MAGPNGVVVVVDRVAKTLDAIHKLSSQRVMVGIPQEESSRKDGGISNAALGYIHNNGAPTAGIPARPHLVPGVESVQKETVADLKLAGILALEGKPDAVERQFHRIGLRAVSAVKRKLNEGVPPPLKAATIAARRRLGFKGTKPLIRTAQLRNAYTYVIRKITGGK